MNQILQDKGQWSSQNQEVTDEATKDQFPENVIRIMATLEMKPMPFKIWEERLVDEPIFLWDNQKILDL